MSRPDADVALATLADLGASSGRGPGWARQEIEAELARAGCPSLPDGPGANLTLELAGQHLKAAWAAALPAHLHLVDDTIWGPPGTDPTTLGEQAQAWRDRTGVAEIAARTGLWQPPSTAVAPTVFVEARVDQVAPGGQRISVLATAGQAQYWSVYAGLRDGQLDWFADFASQPNALAYAARWNRPGTLRTAEHTAALPGPAPHALGASGGLVRPAVGPAARPQPPGLGPRR
jgi:hypothetical protein